MVMKSHSNLVKEQFDIIIEGIGTKPNSEFIKSSNIQIDDKGFIPVNDYFQTNIHNIYALGDVITSHYRHVDLKANVPLAWGAHRAASIIAEHLTGKAILNLKAILVQIL